MKTASVPHLNTLVHHREYNSYQIELKSLTSLSNAIMNKLTDVSPFLLLLVPAFIMMALTVAAF